VLAPLSEPVSSEPDSTRRNRKNHTNHFFAVLASLLQKGQPMLRWVREAES